MNGSKQQGGPGFVAELLAPLTEQAPRLASAFPWLFAVVVLVYALSGVTVVRPDEVAIVLRLGRVVGNGADALHRPGLLATWPRPIDRVVRVPVQRVQQITINDLWRRDLLMPPPPGGGLFANDSMDPRAEGYVITGDRNVLQLRLTARYRIVDPVAWVLSQAAPEQRVRAAVVGAAVRVVGSRGVDRLLAEGREALPRDVQRSAQQRLDRLESGAELLSVELEAFAPPLPVLEAFDAVQGAAIEAATELQRAREYRASELPQAEAEASRMHRDALAFREERVATARGDAELFLALVDEHRRNRDVLRERLYREAVERTLRVAGKQTFVPPPSDESYEEMRITVPSVR